MILHCIAGEKIEMGDAVVLREDGYVYKATVETEEEIKYREVARRDFERRIYAECDKEDREIVF